MLRWDYSHDVAFLLVSLLLAPPEEKKTYRSCRRLVYESVYYTEVNGILTREDLGLSRDEHDARIYDTRRYFPNKSKMWDYGEDNRGSELATISIAMAAVSVLAVALRSYTMSTILKRFMMEDYLAIFVCLLQCGFSAVVVIGVSYGLGAHVENVSVENRHKALMYKWAGQVAYIIVSTLVKFVVGIFLLRLCVNNNWQRLTIIVLLCVVGLFNAFYVFMAIFQCQPIEFYWYRYTTGAPVTGKCNGKALATIPTYFAVLIGLVSDLVLALLPATLLKGANLDKKTKIVVCCVLALGSLASVATIARVPYASQLLSNPDYLYNFTDLAIWSIVECGIAITASSLATLRPLFIQMKLLASSHFTSRYGHSHGGLPMQSANYSTMPATSGRGHQSIKSSQRNTAMTGSTAYSAAANNLKNVKEDLGTGILVEKEFEMSVLTKERSADSIDALEAEVNEVIMPGTAKRKASQDQGAASRRSSYGSQRPAPLQMGFSAQPTSAENSASTSSSTSGPRFIGEAFSSSPSSPLSRGQAFEGPLYSEPSSGMPSPFGHSRTDSQDSPRAPGVAYSPHTNFHLPSRLQHQSTSSNQSDLSRTGSRTTFQPQGLSAPPRVPQLDYAKYVPGSDVVPLGSPINIGINVNPHRRPSQPGSPPISSRLPGSPSSGSAYPFPRQPSVTEEAYAGSQLRPGAKLRVSAFSTDVDELVESSVEVHDVHHRGTDSPTWMRPSPELSSIPSPLRSNPPRSSGAPGNNWL